MEESLDHVFGGNGFAGRIWRFFGKAVGLWRVVEPWRENCLMWWRLGGTPYSRVIFRWMPGLITWHLWKRRNVEFFDGKGASWEFVCSLILKDLSELWNMRFPTITIPLDWNLIVDRVGGLSIPYSILRASWSRPSVGEYKLNVDGCSLGNPGKGGGGALIRNEHGSLVVARIMGYDFVTSLEAETLALLAGLELCQLFHVSAVHVESDSKLLVSLMKGEGLVPWKLQDTVNKLKQFSCVTSIRHVFREANQPADALAKEGCIRQQDIVFPIFAELPSQVRGCINMDRLGVPTFRVRRKLF